MRGKTLCIIQARLGSTRLPGKVLLKVKGIPLLAYEIRRVQLADGIDKIVVATTTNKEDIKVVRLCNKLRVACFRGSEQDVLNRYAECARRYSQYRNIVRVTGDCPLIDPEVIYEVIKLYRLKRYDYAANILEETFPDGLDVEVFTRKALLEADRFAKLFSEREHVTLYIRKRQKYKKGNLKAPADFRHFRFTVDEKEDFEVAKFLITNSRITDGYLHHISLLTKNMKVAVKNLSITRNEGLLKSLANDFITKSSV